MVVRPSRLKKTWLDRLFVVVLGRSQVQLLLRHRLAKILLGERRALVGALRLGADQDDAPAKPLLPQRLCRAATGHVAAHDDDRAHLATLSGPAGPQTRAQPVSTCAGQRFRYCTR